MKRLLAVAALSFASTPALAQENWSHTATVGQFSFFAGQVAANNGLRLQFNMTPSAPLPVDPSVLCAPQNEIYGLNTGQPCPAPALPTAQPLTGQVTLLEFNAATANLVSTLFGAQVVAAAVPSGPDLFAAPVASLPANATVNPALLNQSFGSYSVTSPQAQSVDVRLSEMASYQHAEANTTAIGAVATNLAATQTQVLANTTAIGVVSTDLAATQAQTQTNTMAIGAVATDLAATQTQVQSNTAAIAGNTAQIVLSQEAISALQAQITDQYKQIGQNRSGVAIAMAMSGAVGLQPGEKFRASANIAAWDGVGAYSLSGSMRAGGSVILSGAIGGAMNEDLFGARAGVSVGW